MSFPKSAGQLPVCYNRKVNPDYEGVVRDYTDVSFKPAFAFGYGLSYSKFEYKDFSVTPCTLEELENGGSVKVYITVKNVSEVAGKAVPQLYINRRGGTVSHRPIELKGFKKIELMPQEEKQIVFELKKEDLVEWSVEKKNSLFVMHLNVMLGDASDNILFEEKHIIK